MKKKTTSARRRTHDGSKNYEISGIVIFCFGIFAFISLFGGGTGIMGKWVSDGIHFLLAWQHRQRHCFWSCSAPGMPWHPGESP